MRNVTTVQWSLISNIVYQEGESHFDSIISYLDGNLKDNSIEDKDVIKALGINSNSYRTLRGKSIKLKTKFREKLNAVGFDIVDKIENDKQGRTRKTPARYFQKI